jgi:hypothetical protein
MPKVLVVANQTIAGRAVLDAVRRRHEADPDTRVVICVPRTHPSHGAVAYDDVVYDAAQIRVDLARRVLRGEGIDAIGEVGDPDAYTATMDAVLEHAPDEIVISTLPGTLSGWQRRDLVERVAEATDLPVEHVVVDLDSEGVPFHVTLVVAARTASSEQLIGQLRAETRQRDKPELFILVVPQEGTGPNAHREALARLRQMREALDGEGTFAAGMVGDPDPYTATMNALHFFRVDEVVISTLDEHRSRWLRAGLVDRVRKATDKPVEHIVPAGTPAAA